MQIETLYLTGSKTSDLSPLTSVPLKSLYLGGCLEITDVAALAEVATLENLVAPIQAEHIEGLSKLPKHQRLGFRHTDVDPFIPDTTAVEFWKAYRSSGWIGALRMAGVRANSLQRSEDGTWDVDLDHSTITDLAVLHDAPISRLSLGDTAVADLNPLSGMALKRLVLWKTRVTDLGPLKGMPLEELILNDTSVSDLSPLHGMPLRLLHFNGTKVADLSPLEDMPLTSLRMHDCRELTDLTPLAKSTKLAYITLPAKAKNIDFLRSSRCRRARRTLNSCAALASWNVSASTRIRETVIVRPRRRRSSGRNTTRRRNRRRGGGMMRAGSHRMTDVTQILQAIDSGDPKAAGELLPLVYEELRKLAGQRMRAEAPDHTLEPTALVHEAYIRLVGNHDPGWQNRGHFFAAAAEAMRRVLIESARRRARIKHEGGRVREELAEEVAAPLPLDEQVACWRWMRRWGSWRGRMRGRRSW